ncbi:MAG: hypothetical protein KGH79_00510 [Patescibacteria group bacterium]|nr:hypothetical protein [Patescibacteria group bacterium]
MEKPKGIQEGEKRRQSYEHGPKSREVLSDLDTCRVFVSANQEIQDEFEGMMNAGGRMLTITVRSGVQILRDQHPISSTPNIVAAAFESHFGSGRLVISYDKNPSFQAGNKDFPYAVERASLELKDAKGNSVDAETFMDTVKSSVQEDEQLHPDEQNLISMINHMRVIKSSMSDEQ